MESPEIALEALLKDLFDASQLRRFLRGLPHGEDLVDNLPGSSTSLALLAHEARLGLGRRGMVDATLFEALLRERAGQGARIRELAGRYGLAPGEAGAQISATRDDDLRAARAQATRPVKILFLAANPMDTSRLALDRELRGIRERLQMSALRDRFELVSAWAVRTGDLRQELLTHQPTIVHFSGHGKPDGLILEGQQGVRQRVPAAALAALFGLFAEHVRCVVLNACYSDDQAEAIAMQIPVVVGMQGPVHDLAGVLFADGLYQALAHGRTIRDAVAFGKSAYELEGITATAEPQIRTRPGVDAATVVIVPRP